MAGVNIANQGLTYQRYLPGVVETLNSVSKARALTQKDDKWTGTEIEGRVHVNRNGAIRYGEDGSEFPVPGNQGYVPFKATRKFVMAKIQITDGAMATASGSKNVAKDVVESEVKGMMRDLLKNENYDFFRDGTGQRARLLSNRLASASTDVPVDDGRGLFERATTYDVLDSSSSYAKLGEVTVNDVESALNGSDQVLANLSATVASADTNDILVNKGSYGRAITGLSKLIDDSATTFQAINVGTYPKYSSHVMDNSGTLRALSPTLFRQMLAGISQKAGLDKAPNLKVLGTNWQLINIEELYEGELRVDPSTKVAGMAVSSFQSALGRFDFIPDADAPYNKVFFVDFSKIYRGVQEELKWRKGPGGGIFTPSQQSAKWEATAISIYDLYIKERHTSGRLDDLTETRAHAY